ncbi:MAG: hypothetical protein IK055_01280 [Lachnospiraceae bacterium]|nr:hypothetical protein [Lachnospiraceae bacterium]
MKNSKNDNLYMNDVLSVFGDLPTAEEADLMLAEAEAAIETGIALAEAGAVAADAGAVATEVGAAAAGAVATEVGIAAAEVGATEVGIAAAEAEATAWAPKLAAFNEAVVTELALGMMRATKEAEAVNDAVTGESSETDGTTKSSNRGGRKRRRVLRIALIAACLGALLLLTIGAAAKLIYDVRFTQLIGLEGTMPELENGYFGIGISKSAGGLKVTVVDAIGDSHTQWVEVQTSRRLPEGTPEGFFTNVMDNPELKACLTQTDFELTFYNGSVLSAALSDIDCTDYYYDTLIYKSPDNKTGSIRPFCREGYLWYLVKITTSPEVKVNRGFAHLMLSFKTESGTVWPFEFNWCNNYTAKELTSRKNWSLDNVSVSKVVLTPTSLFVYYEGASPDLCHLDHIRLADGTILYTVNISDGAEHNYQFADQTTPQWDGWEDCSDSPRYKQYSLLPGVSFQAPADMTTLIPMDDILAININGTDIIVR